MNFTFFLKHKWECFFLTLIIFLIWNTGIHSDDYGLIYIFNNYGFPKLNLSHKYIQFVPWLSFKYPLFRIAENHLWLFDLYKMAINFSTILVFSRFLLLYLPRPYHLIISFLFIFFPTHDSTVYWFTGQYFNFAALLCTSSYLLINKKSYKLGSAINLLAAFFSYASPAMGAAFCFLFLLKKEFKKFFIYVTPHFLYFLFVILVFSSQGSDTRIESVNPFILINNLFIHIMALLDAQLGGSFIFKIFYSILSINVSGLLFLGLIVYFIVKKTDSNTLVIPKELIYFSLALLLFAALKFAMTGKYYPMSFNLGNRVCFYSALFFVLIFFNFFKSIILQRTILVIFFAAIFGLSNHWKNWNTIQKNIIQQMKSNSSFSNVETGDTIFLDGGLFSQLGPFSHIEFLDEDAGSIITSRHVVKKTVVNFPFSQRLKLIDGLLYDSKYGTKIEMKQNIWYYHLKTDSLEKIDQLTIQEKINDLPQSTRHWIQLLDSENFIVKNIIKYLPQLNYLWK